MATLDRCVHCGLSRDEHHTFVPAKRPRGCRCEHIEDWGNPLAIPPVCAAYEPDSMDELCMSCEHEKACHPPATPPAASGGKE